MSVLDNNKVTKIYVRYFDIIYNESLKAAIPAAPIQWAETKYSGEIIPVVFIKNKIFEHLDSAAVDSLANKTLTMIEAINSAAQKQSAELQIDCDWTSKTGQNYFYFLQLLKEKIKNKPQHPTIKKEAILSATIRLHQVKYPDRQGIPPVDKGVLMFYNMGKINNNEENSIYHQDLSSKYLSSLKTYPLALDFALPIFAWGVHLREGKVLELLNKMDSRDFEDKNNFEPLSNMRYRAKRSFFKNGFYFRTGDQVKVEEVSADNLSVMASDLLTNYDKTVAQIIFYDLDSINISRYENDIFKKTVADF